MEIYASHRLQGEEPNWAFFELRRLDDILVWHLEGVYDKDPKIIALPENFFSREVYKGQFIYLDGDL